MMKKKHSVKLKKGAWFLKVRGSYLPYSWQAWVSYLPFIGLLVWAQLALEMSSLDMSVAVLIYFSVLVSCGVVMTWIAAHKS